MNKPIACPASGAFGEPRDRLFRDPTSKGGGRK